MSELRGRVTRERSRAPGGLDFVALRAGTTWGQPRLVVALALIVGGLSWAIARGLEFYGLGPVHIAYDLDQPPLLLVLVGTWLLYRSRRR